MKNMDQKNSGKNVTIFFCHRLDKNQDKNRRALEKELGPAIRFFPLPCSGRIDPLQLLKSLEGGADMVYLVTCPEGACRYREGNVRARKRLAYAQKLLEEVGIEGERLELILTPAGSSWTVDQLARTLLDREDTLGPSPLREVRSVAA
jgi:F420-non-reducing hydrogenase iron-sulfur subunit